MLVSSYWHTKDLIIRTSTLLLLAFSSSCFAQTATLQSPNGNMKITILDELNTPTYSIDFKNKPVITSSVLGFEFKQQVPFSEGFKIAKPKNKPLILNVSCLGMNAKQ